MADWQSLVQNKVVDVPVETGTSDADIRLHIAYSLSVDEPDTNSFTVKIDITYVHVRITINSDTSGYVNSASVSWLLGNYNNLFDKEQYSLNQERDESGEYVNEFNWPYKGYLVSETTENETFSISSAWDNHIRCMWNNSPLVFIALQDVNMPVSVSSVCVNSDIDKVDTDCSVYALGSLFSSSKSPIVQVTENVVDITTSNVSHKETGSVLTYDEEFNTDTDFLYVVNPCEEPSLASLELTKSDMESYGLFKYDPSYFSTDDNADPYLVHAFVVWFTSWTRTYEGTAPDGSQVPSNHSIVCRNTSSEVEYTIQYEEFTIPTYPEPSPIGPVEDNTVFRLKRQYNSDGSYVSDGNGNPILSWVKCERIGQE